MVRSGTFWPLTRQPAGVPQAQAVLVPEQDHRLLQVRHRHVDLRAGAEHQRLGHQQHAVHGQRQAMAAHQVEPGRRR